MSNINERCVLCNEPITIDGEKTFCKSCGVSCTTTIHARLVNMKRAHLEEMGQELARSAELEKRLEDVNKQYAGLQDRVAAMAKTTDRLRSLTEIQDALLLAYLHDRLENR